MEQAETASPRGAVAPNRPIPVIDLFAGPGGLNEGFSSLGEDLGNPVFETVGSFEMERNAVSTLTLRSAFRLMKRAGGVPDIYYQYIAGQASRDEFLSDELVAAAWATASKHVYAVELGKDREGVDEKIDAALKGAASPEAKDWVLIGGPPCQAYSMAGRSRRTNDEFFALDRKHFLYEEYLHIIQEFKPAVFVMENVKGLLSSKNNGMGMFDQILRDLRTPNSSVQYEIRSLVVDQPADLLRSSDFVIPSEKFGIPQKRHRVILLGVRSDVIARTDRAILVESPPVTVRDAISDLPIRRSRISPAKADSKADWEALRESVANRIASARKANPPALRAHLVGPAPVSASVARYRKWIADPKITLPAHHESRSHMTSDIERYGHLSARAADQKVSPKFADLPEDLAPNHKNISLDDTPFLDRFRVQVWDSPSTTVVSHIAKDGHYYIHPDETQMRSLTVREAARLQTFPDNYFFEGSRTMQYHQVGNAVPPLLARLIAEKVAETLRLNVTPKGS